MFCKRYGGADAWRETQQSRCAVGGPEGPKLFMRGPGRTGAHPIDFGASPQAFIHNATANPANTAIPTQ